MLTRCRIQLKEENPTVRASMAVVESRSIIEAPDPAQVANGNGYGGLSSLPLTFPREPDGNLEPNDLQQLQRRGDSATFTENGDQNSLQQLHTRGSGATFTKNGEQNSFQTRDNGATFSENGEQNSLQLLQTRGGGATFTENRDGDASPFHNRNNYSSDSMCELEDFLSNLNPFAKEFVPPARGDGSLSPFMDNNRGRKNGSGQGKRRTSTRASRAQREDCVRRTVYVSDIDQQVTEEQLAALFITCGQVVDCRVCGDPNSVLRFAFVEFTDEEGARAALNLSGTMLGYYPVKVLPSKTAIVPVNPTFLPQSEDEREMCSRTIYCTNIDKKVSQADVRLFFESLCGEVSRLRLLGDHHHSTRIAFVEFVQARSAMAALNCSGAILGSLPIRVSPSKTPVRPRFPRSPLFHYAMAFQHVF